ncbi:hypothetical protein AB1Y20_017708 [Prymnesium parvum]|uniref:Reverse transcriptase Ty1/copia-type domain-containing protein n=1 Tax=Prymnesium parvum TaxID=97485 RepID=A0AB34JL05_PRYPA
MATDDTDDVATPAAPSRVMSDIPTPSSYAEATNGRYASRWRDAMNEEIKSLQEHGTWELVERSKLPRGRKPTKSKWVYRVKLNRDGLKLCLQHFDVKNAFTQSDIDHEIYVEPAKGFEVLGAPQGISHPSGNPSGGSMLSNTAKKAGRKEEKEAIARLNGRRICAAGVGEV